MQAQTQHLIVEITEQPIALCQLLKAANLVGGGGEAKVVISEGYVLLNNEVEFQKRKKIYDGDIIEFNGDLIQVSLVQQSGKEELTNEQPADTTTAQNHPRKNHSDSNTAKKESSSPKKSSKKPGRQQTSQTSTISPSIKQGNRKRNPISF